MFRQEMRHNFRTDGHAFFKLGAEVASTKYHILKNDNAKDQRSRSLSGSTYRYPFVSDIAAYSSRIEGHNTFKFHLMDAARI